MSLTGYLADFSLPELLRFLAQGQKTGLLTVQHSRERQSDDTVHYLWFQQGRIVAAANRLDNRGLLSLIEKRGWLSDRVVSKLVSLCSTDLPMGMCLKSQGALQAEQLKILFQIQVLQEIRALFKLRNGWFHFCADTPLPLAEMTGLSILATEVILPSLRSLRDWSALDDKLPDPNSALLSNTSHKPTVQLDTKEWQVWEYADGTVSLNTIAEDLQLPIIQVQRIGFRLMVAGLVEEVTLISPEFTNSTEVVLDHLTPVDKSPPVASSTLLLSPAKHQQLKQSKLPHSVETSLISTSLVKNLVNFLRSKV